MSEHSHPIPNEWLMLYYDGELDDSRREQVEAHLLACIPCQEELAALKALSTVLATDRLGTEGLANPTVQTAWRELESRWPERTVTASSLLGWLPGIGLLIATVLVQFIAVIGVAVMIAACLLGPIAPPLDMLDRALSGWLFGWITWFVPVSWSGWGLSLSLVILSAWLAVFYAVWLGYMWMECRQPVPQDQSVFA
jgi:anti-sigma factor RsiW